MSESSSPVLNATPKTGLVKVTATWVVEVSSPWDAREVKDATDLSEACEWGWARLDRDALSPADAASLRVWQESSSA